MEEDGARYAKCPRCDKQRKENLKEIYGKIPVDEFIAEIKKLKLRSNSTCFKAYHECFFDDKGDFHIDYVARCDSCGFNYKFKKLIPYEDAIKYQSICRE